MGKMFKGLDEFSSGDMVMETDEKGKLSEFRMTDAVRIRSTDMDLDCDLLVYNPEKDTMTATSTVPGKKVKFRTPDASGTCRKLQYNLTTMEAVMSGSPVVVKSGMTLTGDEILILKENGRTKVKVRNAAGKSNTTGDKNNPLEGMGSASAAGKDEKKPAAGEAKPADEVKPTTAKADKTESAPKKATEDDSKGSLAEIPKETAPKAAESKAAEPKASVKTGKATDSKAKSGANRKAAVSN
jgi:hypothetical protein